MTGRRGEFGGQNRRGKDNNTMNIRKRNKYIKKKDNKINTTHNKKNR